MTAMRAGALTSATALEVCSEIKGRPMQIRALPGTRVANPATREILYAPPEGVDVIREKLSNWERFVHADDGLDPVVRMAVAHYQFEAIHPFSDGNGRTGRILNILMLVNDGLLTEPVLFLSRPIIETKSEYYRLLREVTRSSAWEDWILYMIEAVRSAAATTSHTITAVETARVDFLKAFRGTTPGMANADLQAVLFAQPYCRIRQVMERCRVSRPTASAWLSALSDAGALTSVKVGRDRLYLNRAFLDALTASSRPRA
jgi:Fic family protein